MDFFKNACQSGPFVEKEFGLCDDEDGQLAYVNTNDPDRWIATVINEEAKPVTFTAIDKCVIQDNEFPGLGRCDGMLTTDSSLYLVELKNQGANWKTHAIQQLVSTIELLKAHHDISRFRHKKVFACNRKRPAFAEIDNEQNLRFRREHGFRLDVQATIRI